MPGLLRGVARTAVVAGTATAVSGRVQRRQAERNIDRDANIAAQREQSYEAQGGAVYEQVPSQPSQPAAAGGTDRLEQLSQLGELKAQGVLTEEEFAREKAKILNS
jgi:hypothetical protein